MTMTPEEKSEVKESTQIAMIEIRQMGGSNSNTRIAGRIVSETEKFVMLEDGHRYSVARVIERIPVGEASGERVAVWLAERI